MCVPLHSNGIFLAVTGTCGLPDNIMNDSIVFFVQPHQKNSFCIICRLKDQITSEQVEATNSCFQCPDCLFLILRHDDKGLVRETCVLSYRS